VIDSLPDKPLLHLFMHIGRLLEEALRSELALQSLHHGQARVLARLRQGSLIQADIARALAVKPATVTNMLRRMEASGLIERAAHPDRPRANTVSLTRAGLEAAREVGTVWARVEEQLVSGLAGDDLDLLRTALERVRQNLGGTHPAWMEDE
jgi:DNA-binding MarR family transcriptional regulator